MEKSLWKKYIFLIILITVSCNKPEYLPISSIVEDVIDDRFIGNNYTCEEYNIEELYFKEDEIINLPLKISFVKPDSNYKFEVDIPALKDSINSVFNPHKINFEVLLTDTINQPVLEKVSNRKSFMRAYNSDKYIDILIFPKGAIFYSELKGSKKIKNIHGAALDIPSTVMFIREEVFNTHITSHELGHILGVYHIFQEPDESSMGFSCATGDYVNDTPKSKVYPLEFNCSYFPQDTTISELTRKFIVKNIMSYSSAPCLKEFSKGQGERMRKQIELTSDLRNLIIYDEVEMDYNSLLFSDTDVL